MSLNRRHILSGAVAAPFVFASSRFGRAIAAQTLKISHQFPGGTITEGDFRDRLCRTFAAEIEKRSNGALTGQVYPSSSLMKTVAQFSALRKGALDVSLYPISYAGGEFAELVPGQPDRGMNLRLGEFYWQNPGAMRAVRNTGTTRLEFLEFELK